MPSTRNFRARVPLLYTSLKNPVVSGVHCGRRLFGSYSGLSRESTIKSLSYSGLTRVSKEGCFAWILGINPRMTFKVCPRMTENRGFRPDSIFLKKWRKPCVEALKCSEIECLGFTERERDLCLAYFSSFFPLNFE